jgi:hypothetical protein
VRTGLSTGTDTAIQTSEICRYLDEFEWRFNNCKNPFLFRDTILKLIASSNVEYKKLVA